MSIKSFGERIADVLIEDGLLLPGQLEEAMQVQKKQGGRLLKILTDRSYVTEQDMVISMGRCLDTPPINLTKVHVPEEILALVPKEMARAYKLSPVCKLGNKLYVAMADLIPGLHRGRTDAGSLRQIVLIAAGVLTMLVL